MASPSRPLQRVAITGASGLIGRHVRRSLEGGSSQVVSVSRGGGAGAVAWDPARGLLDPADLEGVDAVVHLAGEPIGARRWSERQKTRIRDSRVEGTELLARTLAMLDRPPRVLLSASAVGIYGDRGDEEVTEQSPPGDGFLAEVAAEWEAATGPASTAGVRVVHLRTGIVLAHDGGALQRMLRPFKLGLGGRIGPGTQWMSWITVDDHIRAVRYLLERDDLSGPFNLVGPQPVRNEEFVRGLGAVLGRPTVLPLPALAVRTVFGEMGEALLLWSQRVQPTRLVQAGFGFAHTDLRGALRAVLGRR